ncbi:transcription antitermination factor NusB [uncultured Helicobacter sp.]|uniref:transcription antitermination factor NusB n=1 Tax=Helicobacter sp. TaxID=218 RepID=UPI002A7A2CB7|nr:transcription antitermination factor NusB [Helicobacter sp.]MCI7711392.1 transcription antitermination factor NusB [Helicobacter sp.]MDY2824083.1 transcription antitermination factor NusB [Helicobacter sp.]
MATRTQARNAVLGILYAYDIGNHTAIEEATQILEEKKIRHKQQDFALGLIQGVLTNLENLDTLINTHLKEWDISRLGRIECSILRLGAYELCYTQTDAPIVINEAIELGKIYGDENAPRLINGVLDSIQKITKTTNTQNLEDTQ